MNTISLHVYMYFETDQGAHMKGWQAEFGS